MLPSGFHGKHPAYNNHVSDLINNKFDELGGDYTKLESWLKSDLIDDLKNTIDQMYDTFLNTGMKKNMNTQFKELNDDF